MRKSAPIGLLLVCLPAFAWGPEGHTLVARIAETQLTPAVRARVLEILGPGKTMESVSSWADQIRNTRRDTGPWHYVDIPIDKPHLDMARDCPNGDCVLAKIDQFDRVLKDAAATPDQKREALMFVIHFVGDMHQPLHCSDNGDRGGNSVRVVFNNHPGNLHSLWDGGLLQAMGTEDSLYPKLLRDAERHRKSWAKGTVRDWAEQAHKAAQKTVYGKLPKPAAAAPAQAFADGGQTTPPPAVAITAAYEQRADPVIAQQLEKAGVRLAFLLNSTLQ
jgi:hypothetical protein